MRIVICKMTEIVCDGLITCYLSFMIDDSIKFKIYSFAKGVLFCVKLASREEQLNWLWKSEHLFAKC